MKGGVTPGLEIKLILSLVDFSHNAFSEPGGANLCKTEEAIAAKLQCTMISCYYIKQKGSGLQTAMRQDKSCDLIILSTN